MAKSEKNLNAVFTDTANAIRAKKESVELISPIDFADEIATIETGVNPEGTLAITANGVYDVTVKASVDVNVSAEPQYDELEITENGETDVTDYKTAIVKVVASGANENFLNTILADTHADLPLSSLDNIFTNALIDTENDSYYIEQSVRIPIVESGVLVGKNVIDGGHEYNGNCIIVLDVLAGDVLDSSTQWSVSFNITYADSEGTHTEDEIRGLWDDYFSTYSLLIYDVSGRCIGSSYPDLTITVEGGC